MKNKTEEIDYSRYLKELRVYVRSKSMISSLGTITRVKIKPPYELLRLKYRKGHHIIQLFSKRIKQVLYKCYRYFHSLNFADANVNDIDRLINEIESFIARLQKLDTIANTLCDNMCTRLAIFRPLSQIEINLGNESGPVLPQFTEAFRIFLATELLERGYIKTARLYISRFQIDCLIDAELLMYDRLFELERELEQGKIGGCGKWCKEQKACLKKRDSQFVLKLNIYAFAQLIKASKIDEAFRFAVKHFSAPPDTGRDLLEKALCMLASLNPYHEALSVFFSDGYLKELVNDFRVEYKSVNGLEGGWNNFNILFQYGIMALHTRYCDRRTDFNINCPSCNEIFHKISCHIPFPMRSGSFFKCPLAKKFIKPHEEILATPDGHVYSAEGVARFIQFPENTFRCPETGHSYTLDQLCRVYTSV